MRALSLQGAAQHHTGLKRWSQVLNSHWLPPDPVVMILTITKKGQMGRWMDEWMKRMVNRSTTLYPLTPGPRFPFNPSFPFWILNLLAPTPSSQHMTGSSAEKEENHISPF